MLEMMVVTVVPGGRTQDLFGCTGVKIDLSCLEIMSPSPSPLPRVPRQSRASRRIPGVRRLIAGSRCMLTWRNAHDGAKN
jgi:hypothetical protein